MGKLARIASPGEKMVGGNPRGDVVVRDFFGAGAPLINPLSCSPQRHHFNSSFVFVDSEPYTCPPVTMSPPQIEREENVEVTPEEFGLRVGQLGSALLVFIVLAMAIGVEQIGFQNKDLPKHGLGLVAALIILHILPRHGGVERWNMWLLVAMAALIYGLYLGVQYVPSRGQMALVAALFAVFLLQLARDQRARNRADGEIIDGEDDSTGASLKHAQWGIAGGVVIAIAAWLGVRGGVFGAGTPASGAKA